MKKLNQKNNSASKGFTLIELVVVIGILAVLFAIVLIAINPGRQFAQANDTKRRSDVNAILNAVSQYAADEKGQLPSGIPVNNDDAEGSEAKVIGKGDDNMYDICGLIVPDYISAMPFDPGKTTKDCLTEDYDTGYSIVRDGNRITVSASSEVDPGTFISVTR